LASKIALLELLERAIKIQLRTIFKFGPFGRSQITPFCGHFLRFSAQAAFATKASWQERKPCPHPLGPLSLVMSQMSTWLKQKPIKNRWQPLPQARFELMGGGDAGTLAISARFQQTK
jgi:hypothetical protein